jgi:hypothetical protein
MGIGKPFGTIDFGGIECGHGIGFSSGDSSAYIGWTEELTNALRQPTSADGRYVSAEDYIYYFSDKTNSTPKGYTTEAGGDGPYTHQDDVLDAEREIQYKTIDDGESSVPKHLAIFDISGTFESGRSEKAFVNFNEMQTDVSLPPGIEYPDTVELDKTTETLFVGFENPYNDENAVEILCIDVADPANPVIVDYLADSIAKNPGSGGAEVTALEYHDGYVFGGVADETVSPEEARVLRLQYDGGVSYEQSDMVWTNPDIGPVSFEQSQLSVSSSGVFAVGNEQRLTNLSSELSVQYQKSPSSVSLGEEVLAKGDNVFVKAQVEDSDGNVGEGVALFDSSGTLRGATNNEGGGVLNEGPSIYSDSEYLTVHGGYFYEMEVNEGKKKLPELENR